MFCRSREFNLDASLEMPYEISSLTCITHSVKTKVTVSLRGWSCWSPADGWLPHPDPELRHQTGPKSLPVFL